MSSEKFCLKWNDFESNITSAFREIKEEKDFFDVTIACGDDQVQAHPVDAVEVVDDKLLAWRDTRTSNG